MSVKIRDHIGIYAIIVAGLKVVLIKKSRGPYKGLLDLPGGSPADGETQEDTLVRELDEEIGWRPAGVNFLVTLDDTFGYTSSEGTATQFHHVGHYYTAQLDSAIPLKSTDDGHDSLGATWVDISDIIDGAVKVPPIVKRALLYYRDSERLTPI